MQQKIPQNKTPPDLGACPLLGLARDRWTRFQFPDATHRCWAKIPPLQIELRGQAALCLTSEYRDCLLYHQWNTARAETEA